MEIFSKKINSVIIVEIGSQLKLLDISIKDQIKVNALKIVDIPKDKKKDGITRHIHDFIKENKIKHKNAVLKLALDSFLIKRVQLPALPSGELLNAIKWQLKDEVNFDLSKLIIEFSIIRKSAKPDGSEVLDIMCFLAQEELIKSQVLLLKQVGLNCLWVGLSLFSYEYLIKRYFSQQKDESVGILHFSDEICFFAIYKNNKLEFYRELPTSVNKLKELLKGVFVSDKGRIELTADETQEALFQIGIPQEESVYKDKLSSTQILSKLRPALESLVTDIKRSLTYYDSEFSGGAVSRIFIGDRACKIPNLDSFLREEFSLHISNLSLADKISVSDNVDKEALSGNYASLGLPTDFGKGINFLPREFRSEKIEEAQRISIRLIALVIFILLFVSYYFSKAKVEDYQKRLNSAVLNFNMLSEVKRLQARLGELNNFILDAKSRNFSIGIMFKKLSSITSRELFFKDFSIDFDSQSGYINGFVKSIDKNPDTIITDFIRDMEKFSYIADVSISSVEKKKEAGFDIADFKINFKLR